MKKFTYKIDTKKAQLISADDIKVFEEDNGKKPFEMFLVQAITNRFKDGIGGTKQRTYGRVLSKLDASTDGSISLDSDEYDFVKDMFTSENARFGAAQTRIVVQYIYNIETAPEV